MVIGIALSTTILYRGMSEAYGERVTTHLYRGMSEAYGERVTTHS